MAARTNPPTEAEVKQWLVSHYSHSSRMRRDRMDALIEQKNTYPYLREPKGPKLYRGLFNVTKQTLKKLQDGEETDAVKDKSWTTSKAAAWGFARGEYSDDLPIEGRYAVVLSAPMPSDRALLTAHLTAKEPGIGDQTSEQTGELLSPLIREQHEVLVSGSIKVGSVDFEELTPAPNAMSTTNGYFDDYGYNDGTSPYVKGDALYVPVMDVVGRYWFSAKSVRRALSKHSDAKRIVLQINSPGGDVTEGTAVYNALRADGRPIEAHVYGMAASMASVIMLAADTRKMLPGSFVMIHEPWSIAIGDSAFFEKEAKLLDSIASSMLDIYAKQTGGAADKLREAMKAETWLTADEAVDWGFADEVVDARDVASAPEEASASAEWNARRGLLLSAFKNVPEAADHGERLGWSGPSRDELEATLKAIPRAASFGDAMSTALKLMGATGDEPDVARATEKPKSTPKAAAETAVSDLGTLRIEVSVAQPPAQQALPTPTEAKPLPREVSTSSGTTSEKTKMELSEIAVALGLPPDASAEQIKAAAEARNKSAVEAREQREKAEAEAQAAKALAEERERERLATEAKAALERAQAEAQAAIERNLYERQAYDSKVKALTKGLTPNFAASMLKLCYRDVDPKDHPSGKVPREAGYEAAVEAVKQMPQMSKDQYTGPDKDLESALEAAPVGKSAQDGTSIYSIFPQVTPDALRAHQAKLRERKAKFSKNLPTFTA